MQEQRANQQQQQQPLRQTLPSLLPPNSRDRLEALTQIRKHKSGIRYSDLYCDDSGALFCHVTLHKNVIPYLPKDEHDSFLLPTLITEEQAFELGIEFTPSGCWRNVPTFSLTEPHVLLFKAEAEDFFAARQREMNKMANYASSSSSGGSRGTNNKLMEDAASPTSPTSSSPSSSAAAILLSSSTPELNFEDLPPWMILDKRDHVAVNGGSSSSTTTQFH